MNATFTLENIIHFIFTNYPSPFIIYFLSIYPFQTTAAYRIFLFLMMDSIYLIRFKNLKIDQNISVYIITVLTKVLFWTKQRILSIYFFLFVGQIWNQLQPFKRYIYFFTGIYICVYYIYYIKQSRLFKLILLL